MKRILLTLLCALLTGAGHAQSPQIGCAAEVGAPAGGGRHWVLIGLKLIGDAEAPPAWRVYSRPGAADAPGDYTPLATVQSTRDPVAIAHILQSAQAAGVNTQATSGRVAGIVVDPADPSNAAMPPQNMLAALMQAQSGDGVIEFQRETLIQTDSVAAAVAGRAVFVRVPAAVTTFEIRRLDGAAEGAVIGRATVGAAPEFLPAPAGLTEVAETRPRGHLRVQLRWGAPDALRRKFLHWRGSVVYRANVQHWLDRFGAAPPAVIDRAVLAGLLESGDVVQVNRQPVLPAEIPAVPPGPGEPLFTDDNDSVAQTQTEGAPKFVAGDRYMYWVAETDLLGRAGSPSAGVQVRICDRLAPEPPRGLKVTNQRRFADGQAHDFLRLEWPAAPAGEVRRWYVYVSPDVETALAEYAAAPKNPDTPSLLAVIPNDGTHAASQGMIRFDVLGTPEHPLSAAGKTVYFRLRAEDNTPCRIGGMGNLSGLSGPVPGARHDLTGPASAHGTLVAKCWNLLASHIGTTSQNGQRFTATLRAERPAGSKFSWVEFRDVTNAKFIGRFHFAPGQDIMTTRYQPGTNAPAAFAARFGHPGGVTGLWVSSGAADALPYRTHTWRPLWQMQPGGCPGPHLPEDPETGEPNDICIVMNPGAEVKSWVAYVQRGVNGEKTKFASGNVPPGSGLIETCFNAFPPQGEEICFYVQGFDAGGNPGPMEPLGCVQVAATGGLPVPSIKGGEAVAPQTGDFALSWNCVAGAERFDVAFTPPPPKAEMVFMEADASGALRQWGTLPTPRLAAGFGVNAPEFAAQFTLIDGVSYRAKVRAVRGHGDARDEGAWSLPYALHWLAQPDAPAVPWPQRDVPGIAGEATMAWDAADAELRVLVGTIPSTLLAPTMPLPVDSFEPFLIHPLPLAVYLRDRTAGTPDRMLQVTHRVDSLLSIPAGTNGRIITDQSIKLISGGPGLTQIWLRLQQPVLHSHSYEAHLVLHDDRGELREVRRTNTTVIPAVIEN